MYFVSIFARVNTCSCDNITSTQLGQFIAVFHLYLVRPDRKENFIARLSSTLRQVCSTEKSGHSSGKTDIRIWVSMDYRFDGSALREIGELRECRVGDNTGSDAQCSRTLLATNIHRLLSLE